MRVMSRLLTVAMVSLMFISVNTFAQKGNCEGSNGHKGNGKGAGIENKIPDLTEKQKADIEQIQLDGKKEMLPITNGLGVKRAELQTLRTAEKIDQKAIDAKVKEIGNLRTQMMSLREQRVQKIRSVLTDDQKVVFDSHKGKHSKGHSAKSDCGSKKGKNGGFVIQVNEGEEFNDYIVRVGNQYKWFAEDNNWFTLHPENGDVEISMLRISKGY